MQVGDGRHGLLELGLGRLSDFGAGVGCRVQTGLQLNDGLLRLIECLLTSLSLIGFSGFRSALVGRGAARLQIRERGLGLLPG